MTQLGYIGKLSISRFNRRLHAVRDWLYQLLGILAEVYGQGEVFIIESMPLPVCKRARAWYCKKDVGKRFVGTVPPKRRNSLAGDCT